MRHDLNPNRATRRGYELHAGSQALTRDVAADRATRQERFSEPGERTFDMVLGCWVMAPKQDISRVGIHPPCRGKVHVPDKSGVFWWVGCRKTGFRHLKIEALDFYAARAEADRLYPGERPTLARVW